MLSVHELDTLQTSFHSVIVVTIGNYDIDMWRFSLENK